MPDGRESITVSVLGGLSDQDSDAWNACAGADPFTSHGFLSALEDSGSVGAEAGWAPRHLAVHAPDGRLSGIAPLYLKNNSYGEYVFDWSWADAYARAGGQYYPKLQCAVPFTPVTGPRLLVRPDAPADTRAALAAGLVGYAEKLGVSSLHVTFPDRADWALLADAGLLQRIGYQYHWENKGYETFDDFLGALNARKRKAIRKERRAVTDQNITMRILRGADITEAHWAAFYRFYRNTVDMKWGSAYLTRSFFPLMGERLGDRVVLVVAEQGGRMVAAALNLMGGDALYGRNWGCDADFKFLHFETCYYQAIDFAIANGLKWVEAGAQGRHKVQRGYLPRTTYSAHWIGAPGFRAAVERFLGDETAAIRDEMAEIKAASPFARRP